MRLSVTFDEIKRSKTISGKCLKCNKRRSKVVSSLQTINPYNKNKDGFPKSRDQIMDEVMRDVENQTKKLKNNFVCSNCRHKEIWGH